MQQDRRNFLARAIPATAAVLCGSQAGLGQATEPSHDATPDCSGLEGRILDLFSDLPDRKAFKIWAPATENSSEFLVQLNASQRMFVASTMKSVILCERLRQLDSDTVEKQITGHQLALDENVWSPGSPIFNPPDLSGLVSERTAMEAMMVHSDNTATDMVLKEAGADAVRSFIASIGLKKTMIPDSTRIFAAYLFGIPDYETVTWKELTEFPPPEKLAHPFLNDVETFASSPDDLVSFFSRALQGQFFSHQDTLFQFRRILSLGDINHLVSFPLGLSVFGKAGYADIPDSHARSIAGAVYFPDRWVYFSMVLNWDAEQAVDPATVEKFYGAIRESIASLQQCLGS
jgi:beta-lactamase class A